MQESYSHKSNNRLTKLLGHFIADNNHKDSSLKSCITAAPKYLYHTHPSSFPGPSRSYWGTNTATVNDKNIETFNPAISDIFSSNNQHFNSIKQYIELWLQSNNKNRFNHSIKQNDDNNKKNWKDLSIMKGHGYGINFDDFSNLMRYWNNKFNPTQYISKLNNFKHFRTSIQGLNIHFIKERSSQSPIKNNKCDAIILLHGWPGSLWEFHKIIDLLKQSLYNIDIIIPSLPGYGFSESPTNYTNFNVTAVASIMKDLMENRLKYKNYIAIGGDWGSLIVQIMGYLSCNEEKQNCKLLGILTNNAFTSGLDLNENSEIKIKHMMPVIDKVLDFSGYQHIQSTRPNTIGISLETSPIAILSWIYEKYLSWTDGPNKYKQIKYDDMNNDNRMLSGKLNWDDVIMTVYIYWLSGRITSGINYYAENMRFVYSELRNYYMPKNVNVGIVDWNDSIGGTKDNHKYHFRNIVYYKSERKGGHFAALETPKQYVDNIVKFVGVFQN